MVEEKKSKEKRLFDLLSSCSFFLSLSREIAKSLALKFRIRIDKLRRIRPSRIELTLARTATGPRDALRDDEALTTAERSDAPPVANDDLAPANEARGATEARTACVFCFVLF